MGRIVADATPIVYLAKIGKLQLLKQLYEDVIIPPRIREELFTGKHPEIPVIQEAYDAGWLEERTLNQNAKNFQSRQLRDAPGLHQGESQAIALSYTGHLPLIIDEDDKTGRRIARVWGVEVKGTLRVILEAYEARLVQYDETRDLFRSLLAERFRVTAEVYERALALLEKAKERRAA
jgi:predicted nucleic acid-binding protein